MRSTSFVLLLFFVASCSTPERKRDATTLPILPSPDAVLAQTKGKDDLTTAALQRSALKTFVEMAGFITLKYELPVSEYGDIQKEYRTAMDRVVGPIVTALLNAPSKAAEKKLDDAWQKAKKASDELLAHSSDSLFTAYQVSLTQAEMNTFKAARATTDLMDPDIFDTYAEKRREERTVIDAVQLYVPLVVGQFICILLIIGVMKGYRYAKGTVALSKEDPTILIADGMQYNLNCYTGRVVYAASATTTHTSVRSNQNYIESSSYSVEHDKFHVVDVNGKEHAVHLWNSSVQIRPGSIVSAAWFEGPGAKKSDYVLFMNHDTDNYTALWGNLDQYFHSRSSRMATNGFWLATFSITLALFMVFLARGTYDHLFLFYLILQALVGVGCWLGALLAYGGLRTAQRNGFSARDVPRLADYLRKREFAIGPVVEG
ncbi:MAG TPA: hypothetical protein PLB89_07615 [Flavobacteriales bacterium]|nr:hypothetical protein [Flavobacteriales bacterium]